MLLSLALRFEHLLYAVAGLVTVLALSTVAALVQASSDPMPALAKSVDREQDAHELHRFQIETKALRDLQLELLREQFGEDGERYLQEREWLRADLLAADLQSPVSRIEGRMASLEASWLAAQSLEFALLYSLYLSGMPHASPLDRRLVITSGFGQRPNPFGRGGIDFHRGVDLRAAAGEGARSVAAGVVSRTERRSDGYGNNVRILHSSGYESLYAHLDAILVSPGMNVRPGQIIGLAGSSGAATGPHLHFEIRRNRESLDPRPFLP